MKPNSSLAGWYVGTCNDSPEGGAANFMLNVYGATDTSLKGELAYFDEVNIVVPFRGIIVDDQIAFTTVSPDEKTLVVWQGTISELEWTGTALLLSNNPEINTALEPQEAAWSCRLVRSAGAMNPAAANTVWVYHDGVEYGPFTTAKFIQRLNACECPRPARACRNANNVVLKKRIQFRQYPCCIVWIIPLVSDCVREKVLLTSNGILTTGRLLWLQIHFSLVKKYAGEVCLIRA